MWLYSAVLLFWAKPAECAEQANTSNLFEWTAVDFYDKLHAGKLMFLYFEHEVSPTISLFLLELEKSSEILKDYGVLVGKINCNKETVSSYCIKERSANTAFLFRSGREFLSFNLDTIFDINSIVSEVLFAILRDEVQYVHTDADLLALEKRARGKMDLVLGHVSSLGTQEHRSLMETAYVYGSTYKFILITGGPVLRHLGVDESSPSSKVWFLHCRLQLKSKTNERCPLTLMRKHLTTLNLHSFLQLMEAPLVSEADVDPSSVPHKQAHQVFLFSHPATEQLDRATANALAWKLRGLAALVLVHRRSPAVKTPVDYNVAYRLAEMKSEVKYLTLQNLDEVVNVFLHQENDDSDDDDDEEEMDENIKDDVSEGELDDEIAEAVYKSRADLLDLEALTSLTSENYHATVAQSDLTVVLFYVKWNAVSMDFLGSFLEVAEKLTEWEITDVQMSAVDCGEWTDLCAGLTDTFQPVTAFPTVLLLRPEEAAQEYRGMLGSEALLCFIMLSRLVTPRQLSTTEDVASFLEVVPHAEVANYDVDRVLGLFPTNTGASLKEFSAAMKSLRGRVLSGSLTDELALQWAAGHSVEPPAVAVFPSWQTDSHPSVISAWSSAEELVSRVNMALRHPMPEVTVESLPSFLEEDKALLLLFVGDEEDDVGRRQNTALVGEMRLVAESGGARMQRYTAGWIHLGRTPAAMSVLGSYLGSMPLLPALILTRLTSGSEVYQYPPNAPVLAHSVLQWLRRVEEGREPPAGSLEEESWRPASDFLDFLKIMDEEDPDFARQQVSREDGDGSDSSADPRTHIHSEL
ncbi:thioredoxin domain-containing protein 16 isoform 1-T1 [Synchiropus picturatus]